jgi:hypothetical protein
MSLAAKVTVFAAYSALNQLLPRLYHFFMPPTVPKNIHFSKNFIFACMRTHFVQIHKIAKNLL